MKGSFHFLTQHICLSRDGRKMGGNPRRPGHDQCQNHSYNVANLIGLDVQSRRVIYVFEPSLPILTTAQCLGVECWKTLLCVIRRKLATSSSQIDINYSKITCIFIHELRHYRRLLVWEFASEVGKVASGPLKGGTVIVHLRYDQSFPPDQSHTGQWEAMSSERCVRWWC